MMIHVPYRLVQFLQTQTACTKPLSGVFTRDIEGQAMIEQHYRGIFDPRVLKRGQAPYIIHALPCDGNMCSDPMTNINTSSDMPTPTDISFAIAASHATGGNSTVVFTYQYVYTIQCPPNINVDPAALYNAAYRGVGCRQGGPQFAAQWLCNLRANNILVARNFKHDPLQIVCG